MDSTDLGFIGGTEILVLLVLLAIPVGLVLLVLFLVKITQRPGPPQVMVPPSTPEQRLKELDALKAQNLVTDEEYEAKRNDGNVRSAADP